MNAELTGDDAGLARLLSALDAQASGAVGRQILERVAPELSALVRRGFDASRSPRGPRWRKLKRPRRGGGGGGPLATVPSDLVRDVCVIAAADVAAVIGYGPSEGADRLLEARAKAARERLAARRSHVTGARAQGTRTTPQGPRAWSPNTRR